MCQQGFMSNIDIRKLEGRPRPKVGLEKQFCGGGGSGVGQCTSGRPFVTVLTGVSQQRHLHSGNQRLD